ncbi:LuxR family transcriptional regulator [Reticulibacter mediterranei]|uniref:LuxR family transcriptional regulator n=1 Tax=Reticulibacter mediterranei TaxID=2778369 RepID=A0A8J3IRB8_9CHLR|nr:tetratricopeptide repeat protein [Reticulibacter mediterranei]GHO93966.1 LuxR family transcriptional regulator [Reticulibacter mediterranei]
MPRTAQWVLRWSSERDSYELLGQGNVCVLQGKSEWLLDWLMAHSSFSFQGKQGRVSLLKEARSRGEEGYWYAYRSYRRQTLKKYAGRSADLTVDRLETVARALTNEGEKLEQQPVSLIQRVPLLPTKLHPPRQQSRLVARERLLARLDSGLAYKCTLLSAPAGFGKTTLVSQWIADRCEKRMLLPVAWVSLEARDNSLSLFWRSLITACQLFDSAIGQSSLELLDRSQKPSAEPLSFDRLLAAFVNDLVQLADRRVLILEDYHVIASAQIHETLMDFIDHLPPSLHVVIVTRSDPPLPLARWRAQNDAYELRAIDLRFSSTEAQVFLKQNFSLQLATAALQRFLQRTEGWVAGMKLTVLALQGRDDPQEIEHFLSTFSGSHRHILEYLVIEVLNAQPEPLQTFLLQSSLLDSLTGTLCDAITGRHDSVLLLEQLERTNLFLLALDGSGHWYRYYALFAEAMRHEARRRLDGESIHTIYMRASLWYEQQEMWTEAIEAALSIHDFLRAARLIERVVEKRETPYQMHLLRGWLEQLPEAILHEHPTLDFALAVTLLFTLDRSAPASRPLIEAPLKKSAHYWRSAGNDERLGIVLAFHSLLVFWQGDYKESSIIAKQALELLPAHEVDARGMSLLNVGLLELLMGRLQVARQVFTEARSCCEAAKNLYSTLAALIALGEICYRQGELHQAEQFYQQVLRKTEDGRALDDRGHALAGRAQLSYEWNRLELAEQQGREALAIGKQLSLESLLVVASLVLAQIHVARGEVEQAMSLLQEAIAQAKKPRYQRELHLYQARLALLSGDVNAVQRWEASMQQASDDLFRLQQEQEALLQARLLISQGEAEAALSLLDCWLAEAREMKRARSEIEILLQQALAYGCLNDQPRAGQALLQALEQARPEGCQRVFLDEGRPIEVLLRSLLAEMRAQRRSSSLRSSLLAYMRLLLFAFQGYQAEGVHRDGVVRVLSPQEQRVLRLLVAGNSGPEIAEELVVSINTVKTQVKSIYRKLNVTSRQEAHEVAHLLHLL